MLLLFCATFIAHSEHYTQVEFELYSTFEQHDCHLCQQGIDSPPKPLRLIPVSTGITNIDKIKIIDEMLVVATYISPQLRAPPSHL